MQYYTREWGRGWQIFFGFSTPYFYYLLLNLLYIKKDLNHLKITVNKTVILVRSVKKFLDRNFLFIEKVKASGQNKI